MRIAILGGGRVGGVMAADLVHENEFQVTVVDRDLDCLQRLKEKYPLEIAQADLSIVEQVGELVKESDLVLNAVPGFLGFQVCKGVLESGKDLVDISFFPEDPFELHDLAEQQGVTALVDCGVAPGMSNILAAHADSLLDQTETVLIYVGGLPVERTWPLEYKAPCSPAVVIEEYTRPARFIENGEEVVRPALSQPEHLHFDGVGTLEAFNTDGLRTLAHTVKAPFMKEKTLRYPGHIDKIKVLKELGFFDSEELSVKGQMVRPFDFTSSVLFKSWQYGEGEADITVMRVIVDGQKDKKLLRLSYDLYDRFDAETGFSSMARATGFTATAAIRMLAKGLFSRKGVIAPGLLGCDAGCYEFLIKELAKRDVNYRESITTRGEVKRSRGFLSSLFSRC